MIALITFCNNHKVTFKTAPGLIGLVIDLISGEMFQLSVKHDEVPLVLGATGACRAPSGTAICIQSNGYDAVGVFNNDWKLRKIRRFQKASAAHAICYQAQSRQFAVNGTGVDLIVGLTEEELDGEEVLHDFSGTGQDQNHNNSVAENDNALFASGFGQRHNTSGFGQRHNNGWGHSKDGFIRNLETGEDIVTGIHHPHSVSFFEGGMYYCESLKRRVMGPDGIAVDGLNGYARGLDFNAGLLAVGTGKRRKQSFSTGKSGSFLEGHLPDEGLCGVHFFTTSDLENFEQINFLDLSHLADEVFEVLLIE